MKRDATHRIASGRNSARASRARGRTALRDDLLLAAGCLWWLIRLPPRAVGLLWRCCVMVGAGAIRAGCLALLGGIGLLLIGSLCFGVGSVLFYPLWR
ncbi:hypothetical protein HUX88_03225 [Duganella sp. BJB1802]|uniref:hypothetical protein n=1 Tax=Duganella sp. BJB1802 TaxID=2744575 RepID=UPI0015932090|nr:hypothetical protein [Duganella sp. BJB1802]NVD69568.1 hypothetical protein [Duganella sp. BJB1802]